MKESISRRNFINTTTVATAGVFLTPAPKLFLGNDNNNESWPSNAKEYSFHMIGHGHIDPVWLWPWHEGMSVVHSTFRTNLDRMNETEDFYFIASSALFYKWVAETDPGMLNEIRERVKEGRWIVVGGWWIEPDANTPGGEALVRQGLYGQKTLQKLLGVRAKVGMNADSFGHAGTLPQILNQQGMESYMFHRPGFNEKDLPSDLFWWEGSDGSKVLSYRIPYSYNDTGSISERMIKMLKLFKDQPMKSYMSFYGAGDHGGGATKENIRAIKAIQMDKDAPKVIFSTPERYFDEIRKDKNLNVPTVKDDLQHHAVGCYTAEIELKKYNRLAEAALILAEKIAAVGSVAWSFNHPQEQIATAWQKVLFHQFHDSLPGTSIPEHSDVALGGYHHALDAAEEVKYRAGQKLEWQIPAEDPNSQYIIAFNPLPWEVKKVIDYDFDWDNNPSRVEDESGNPLDHQWSAASSEANRRRKLVVETNLPPFGYRQIRLRAGETPSIKNGVSISENNLENEFYKIRFLQNGEVGILDKQSGAEVFGGNGSGGKAVVINDPSDTWSHKVVTYADEIGAFGDSVVKKLEEGPVRSGMRVITIYGKSTLTVDWLLTKNSRFIDANVKLDWHEKHKMLKFSFPVNVSSPVSTYEIPYGHIIRETNGDENPGQRWIDVSGEQRGKGYGLTVFNDAKYGYNVIGNDMRISVARSAVYAHHEPRVIDKDREYHWMDQGIHTFRMSLLPHSGGWKENNIPRLVEEFMELPVCFYQGIHGGALPKSGSFLSIDKSNIIVSAIKQAEDNNDIILRCVESFGMPTTALLDLRFAGRTWTGSFRPFEIKSLRLNNSTGKISQVNLLEEFM